MHAPTLRARARCTCSAHVAAFAIAGYALRADHRAARRRSTSWSGSSARRCCTTSSSCRSTRCSTGSPRATRVSRDAPGRAPPRAGRQPRARAGADLRAAAARLLPADPRDRPDRPTSPRPGHHLDGYARNWLLITAALFAASALVYAVGGCARARRVTHGRRRAARACARPARSCVGALPWSAWRWRRGRRRRRALDQGHRRRPRHAAAAVPDALVAGARSAGARVRGGARRRRSRLAPAIVARDRGHGWRSRRACTDSLWRSGCR